MCRYIQRTLATSVAGQLTRHEIVKSALVCLRQHAALFEANLTQDPLVFYQMLEVCCTSPNKTVRTYMLYTQ
jgi:hypothetical protein